MSDNDQNDNGQGGTPEAAAPGTEDQSRPNVRVVAQFIRDLSFESPNIEKLLDGPGDNPNLQLQVNVNARVIKQGMYESIIDLKAHATNSEGVIYDLELTYGGVFAVSNIPPEAIEPFLLVNCPSILFPFLRRLVADLTREGGFPPLFLDPIDFASLYMRRKQEQQQQSQLVN
jgi:preprotein translocase subunit SecB